MAVPATFLSFKERTACSSAWAGNVGFAGAFQNIQAQGWINLEEYVLLAKLTCLLITPFDH